MSENTPREHEANAIREAKTARGIHYPALRVVLADGQEDGPTVAFRMPTGAEWMRYREAALNPDPAVKARAFLPLVVGCLIYPDVASFEAMVAARPGIIEACANPLVEYAGVEQAKKVDRI